MAKSNDIGNKRQVNDVQIVENVTVFSSFLILPLTVALGSSACGPHAIYFNNFMWFLLFTLRNGQLHMCARACICRAVCVYVSTAHTKNRWNIIFG